MKNLKELEKKQRIRFSEHRIFDNQIPPPTLLMAVISPAVNKKYRLVRVSYPEKGQGSTSLHLDLFLWDMLEEKR